MPAPLHSKAEVVDRLMTVIRHRGYDGASLAELSAATGLGKSSLYHYFPDGKDDMVRAVLDHLGVQLQTLLFDPLRGDGPPTARLAAMVRTLDAYYRHGHESCVLAQLVLGGTRSRFGSQLKAIFTEWTSALASLLTDAGLPRSVARYRAEDAVLRVEGALVLAGGMGDAGVFDRMLRHLPAELLAPVRKTRK